MATGGWPQLEPSQLTYSTTLGSPISLPSTGLSPLSSAPFNPRPLGSEARLLSPEASALAVLQDALDSQLMLGCNLSSASASPYQLGGGTIRSQQLMQLQQLQEQLQLPPPEAATLEQLQLSPPGAATHSQPQLLPGGGSPPCISYLQSSQQAMPRQLPALNNVTVPLPAPPPLPPGLPAVGMSSISLPLPTLAQPPVMRATWTANDFAVVGSIGSTSSAGSSTLHGSSPPLQPLLVPTALTRGAARRAAVVESQSGDKVKCTVYCSFVDATVRSVCPASVSVSDWVSQPHP